MMGRLTIHMFPYHHQWTIFNPFSLIFFLSKGFDTSTMSFYFQPYLGFGEPCPYGKEGKPPDCHGTYCVFPKFHINL